jgi:hypothetical protein
MRKFRFIDISFEQITNPLYVAIEEINSKYTFVLNGFYMFKNSKGEEYDGVVPYKRSTVDLKVGEMEVRRQLDKIKNQALEEYKDKFDGNFDDKIHIPHFNHYEDLDQFSPYGFNNSTYDDICETIISTELLERFEKIKDSHSESKQGS